jgi:hypothetical protein
MSFESLWSEERIVQCSVQVLKSVGEPGSSLAVLGESLQLQKCVSVGQAGQPEEGGMGG